MLCSEYWFIFCHWKYHLLIAGCEAEFIEGICGYLNEIIKGLTPDQLERKYRQLVATHRDIVFSQYKFQNRESPNQEFSFVRRLHFEDFIKYESVSD